MLSVQCSKTIQRSLIISLSYLSSHPSLRPLQSLYSSKARSLSLWPAAAAICRPRQDLQTRIGGLSPPRSVIRSALILLSPASLYLTSELGRPAYFRNKYLGIVNNKVEIITLSPFAAFIKAKLAKRTCAAPQQICIRLRHHIEVIFNSITFCFDECTMQCKVLNILILES